MLRASGRHLGRPPALGAVSGVDDDPVTPAGREIIELTDAVVAADATAVAEAGDRLSEVVGSPGAVRVVAVAANFQMMNRMLDAIGVTGSPSEVGARIHERNAPFCSRTMINPYNETGDPEAIRDVVQGIRDAAGRS